MPKAIRDLIQKYSRDPQTVRIEQKEMTVADGGAGLLRGGPALQD